MRKVNIKKATEAGRPTGMSPVTKVGNAAHTGLEPMVLWWLSGVVSGGTVIYCNLPYNVLNYLV